MARENRDQRAADGSGGPAPEGSGDVPSPAVPAQRPGRSATPRPAPPVAAPPPPGPPPAMPLSQAPQSAVPSEDPSATGRRGESRTKAPAAPPAAPRGRDTTDRSDDSHASGDGAGPAGQLLGDGHGDGDGVGVGVGPAGQLLGDGERDRLGQRLHHALARFVDSPHDSVAEAAEVLAEAEQELVASLRDRRTALRAGWQQDGDPSGPGLDTEQLRLTLRTYREVTERLLRA